MIDERTKMELKDIPILEEPQLYIYVLLNSAGKVKVGVTKNIEQRVQSLSGSNSAGDKIIKCYCSSVTYLYTLEKIMHEKMAKYRISGTEWFFYKNKPDGELLYSSAVNLLERLMSSDDCQKCNDLRKQFNEKKENL